MTLKVIIRKIRKRLSGNVYNIPISPGKLLKLKMHRLSSELNSLLTFPQRNFHAFCIGLPRSGTHTLAYIFNKNYSAAHEPIPKETIINIMDWYYGKYSKIKMLKILAFRDKILRLEMEASHYLHHITGLLVELFPQAKFILTVREPMSWLESEINQNYINRDSGLWRSLDHYRYSRYNYEHEFSKLKTVKNIYPIRSYLSYWKDHVSTVLCNVPSEKLLIIDTFEISKEMGNIESFVGIGSETLDLNKKHSGKRYHAFSLYENADQNKVRELVQIYCQEFIQRNLPFMIKYLNKQGIS